MYIKALPRSLNASATNVLGMVAAALAGLTFAVAPVNAQESGVLNAMRTELDRSMAVLQTQEVPPYFLSYEITDIQNVSANASFGELISSNDSRQRLLDIDVRVGDYQFDNSRQVRGQGRFFSGFSRPAQVPVEDD